MAENRAHGESREQRLRRFQNGPPLEIIDTLLISIASFFNNEIRLTTEGDNYQSSLLFLGIHAVALTVAEGLFDKRGVEGYKAYLVAFVDGDTDSTRFSTIAQEIHDWRNVLAHQWLGSIGHSIGYDYAMANGWEKRDEVTFINPRIYRDQYLEAFGGGGRIYDYAALLNAEELEAAKDRLINKYQEN